MKILQYVSFSKTNTSVAFALSHVGLLFFCLEVQGSVWSSEGHIKVVACFHCFGRISVYTSFSRVIILVTLLLEKDPELDD